ncbi:MAG: hypothetical protein JXD22_14365 [Sedimentisphaerales bacterium]|nr:hypothetical protein [Sedimentisphaerales bacterium]
MQTQKTPKRNLFLIASVLFTFGILLTQTLWAPPPRPRPRRSAPPRIAKPAKIRPKAAKPLPARVKPATKARYVRHRHYWHPRYKYTPKRTNWIWKNLGYRYYLGGTEYVVVPDTKTETVVIDNTTTTPPAVDLKNDEKAIERYEQIQELFELIYEWRTLNESPDLHNRLPEENATPEQLTTLEKIQTLNQQFDQVSRQAMAEIALGNPADNQLESANKHLTTLIESVESLPEITDSTPESKD